MRNVLEPIQTPQQSAMPLGAHEEYRKKSSLSVNNFIGFKELLCEDNKDWMDDMEQTSSVFQRLHFRNDAMHRESVTETH